MNYYIKFENNFYNVIEVNTGQMIASFISDIEANEFVQSLFDMSNNSHELLKQNLFSPYNNINYQSLTPQLGAPLQNQFGLAQPWNSNSPLQSQTPNSQNGGQTTVFNNYWQAPNPQNSYVQGNSSLSNPLSQNQYPDQQNINQLRVPNNGNQMFQNQDPYSLENQYGLNSINSNLSNNLNLQKNRINENIPLSNNRNFLNSNQPNLTSQNSYLNDDFSRGSFCHTDSLNSNLSQNQKLNDSFLESKNLVQESFNEQSSLVNNNLDENQKNYEKNNLGGAGFASQNSYLNKNLSKETKNSEIEIAEKNIFEEVENDFKFDFNDNTLSVDTSLFEEDKMGAIIYVPKNFINNTDDDSLGEVAAYQDMKHVSKDKLQYEDQEIHYKESSNLESDNFFENSIQEVENKEKTLSEIYEKDLVSETYLLPKRDPNIIDLGPINEYDEVFSTPRKDTEKDDLESLILSKKEKKDLKKIKKLEKGSRKKEK
ncbi:hypothetical protein [Spiroplasma endosymbiont of Atherix ibis]|uniref:hypothetical protein n=1 Tax=Spiroplasma endosymbiont of Atherix ibis TaxID=3066291 RepID=UPI0030CB62D5